LPYSLEVGSLDDLLNAAVRLVRADIDQNHVVQRDCVMDGVWLTSAAGTPLPDFACAVGYRAHAMPSDVMIAETGVARALARVVSPPAAAAAATADAAV
jgi:hypothetical protein